MVLVNIRALLIDENSINRTLFSLYLHRYGVQVEQAETIADAKLAIKGFQPDVVITEVFIEEQHCLLLLEFCKARQVPVIVLTGSTDPYEQEVKEFVEAYYKKPINPCKILPTLLSLAPASGVSHHLNTA